MYRINTCTLWGCRRCCQPLTSPSRCIPHVYTKARTPSSEPSSARASSKWQPLNRVLVHLVPLSCCSLGHLSDWFRIIASSPSIGDDLYTAAAFLVTTGESRLMDSDSGHYYWSTQVGTCHSPFIDVDFL